MNRAQRRKQQKNLPKYMRGTAEQRKAALYKNGITIEDLERVEKESFEAGWKQGVEYAIHTCYAATLRTTRGLLRFGRKRNTRFMKQMDYHVVHTIDSQEAIEAAYREAGILIDFNAVFDDERVQEASDAG